MELHAIVFNLCIDLYWLGTRLEIPTLPATGEEIIKHLNI